MAEGSVNAWINDYAEAIAIGRAIGGKVVVIGTSTGASLATWAASQARPFQGRCDDHRDLAELWAAGRRLGTPDDAMGRHARRADDRQGAQLRADQRIACEAVDDEISDRAVLPLAALTKLAYATPVEAIAIPALFIFSDDDKVVRPELTREIAGRWGARHELVPVERSGDPYHHVIAGDALSPATTQVAGRPHRGLGEGGGGVSGE